jgi:hypothetical protein
MKDKIAPPLPEFTVKDKLNAEGKLVLEWNQSASDTDYYEIYYNESDFDNISKASLLNKVEDNGSTEYSLDLDFEDEAEYYFAITATDKRGNVNETIKAKPGMSVDDLAPPPIEDLSAERLDGNVSLMWTKPEQYPDASYVTDVFGFRIYAADSEILSVDFLNPFKSISPVEAGCDFVSNCNYILDITGLTYPRYYFAVTAQDEKGNENKTTTPSIFSSIE